MEEVDVDERGKGQERKNDRFEGGLSKLPPVHDGSI